MEIQYINKLNKQLYSVYHEPNYSNEKNIGVLICNPIGQEYIRCHRININIANNFAKLGFHVLRFDYHGTGDSLGEFSSFSFKSAIEDIDIAVDELQEACGLDKIILLGTRLGGTLALMYAEKKKQIDSLILWNPILNGTEYINELDNIYKKWLKGSFTKDDKLGNSLSSFGYLYQHHLISSILKIEINPKNIRIKTLLIHQDYDDNISNEIDSEICLKRSESHHFWLKKDNESNKSYIPIDDINIILTWLSNNV